MNKKVENTAVVRSKQIAHQQIKETILLLITETDGNGNYNICSKQNSVHELSFFRETLQGRVKIQSLRKI